MENKNLRLNLKSQMEKVKKRMVSDSSIPASVTDEHGNKIIPAYPDLDDKGNKVFHYSYPYLGENVFAVHNPILYKIFTLDFKNEPYSPIDFIPAYGVGFKEGLKFLETERIVIDNFLDVNKRAALIEILKRLLHQRKFDNKMSLIQLAFCMTPWVLTTETIKTVAKYSGMVAAIDQFADRTGLDANDLKNDQIERFEFVNEFDNVPEKLVYEYFHQNLVEKGFLSKNTLNEYLSLAFGNNKTPTTRFDFENSPKVKTIINIFYTYYLEEAHYPHTRKIDYCNLLGEYFNNYTTQKVSNNWSRYYQKVRK